MGALLWRINFAGNNKMYPQSNITVIRTVLTVLDTCGQTDGRTKDTMQLTGTFRDCANALNKIYRQERG